jgi:hypothetical protein
MTVPKSHMSESEAEEAQQGANKSVLALVTVTTEEAEGERSGPPA